jgi:hypothetical protein
VNWPTPIVASANSGNAISRVNVLIDGNPAFATDRGTVNSALKVFVGSHHISVQAFDTSGAMTQSSVDVVGEPGNLPPTANITVVPLHSVSPTTVLACSVGSHDPDGFILQYKSVFSDGAIFFAPAVVHTLPGPGSFSVTANVIDQFGAPASATQNFNVSTLESGNVAAAHAREQQTRATQRQFEPIRRP